MRGGAIQCVSGGPPAAAAAASLLLLLRPGLPTTAFTCSRGSQRRMMSSPTALRPILLSPPIPSSSSSSSSHLNFGSADGADKMVDDLFDKYGEVYSTAADTSSEADGDAETLSFAVTLAKGANEVKAADIRVLFVKPLVYWTRFFIIATAFSNPQIDAISSKIRDIAEKQFSIVASGDTKPNSWTLLDFGDVIVHIFLPQQRAFYNLEEFYGNATHIELPFDTQPSLRD